RSAARANIRPNFIANDIVLTSLAARPVTSVEELRQVRGLTAGTVDRHAKGILAAIHAGLACPPERRPEPAERHRRKGPPPGLVALPRAAVQAVAEREDIAPAGGGAPNGRMPPVRAAVAAPVLGREAARLRLRAVDLAPAAVPIDDLVAAGEDLERAPELPQVVELRRARLAERLEVRGVDEV